MGPGPGLLPREGQVDLRFLTSWHKPLELELGASHEVKCVLLMSQDIRKRLQMCKKITITVREAERVRGREKEKPLLFGVFRHAEVMILATC